MRNNTFKLLFVTGALSFLTMVACGGKPSVSGTDNDFAGSAGTGGSDPTGGKGGTGGGINIGDGGEGAEGGANPLIPPCGDGELGDDEECDDGNEDDDDGCDSECNIEGRFVCPDPGQPCEECGNDSVEPNEECDDGNFDADDGCSASCQIEGDFQCPVPGLACNECGNGDLEGVEYCDDGDTDSGDGCSDDCSTIEAGFSCPVPGEPCEECGDGVTDDHEACDDGNRYSGDGCLFNCTEIETGFTCPSGGGQCRDCGNGIVELGEDCDDANDSDGDGCDATCDNIEPGFLCVVPGRPCFECGNGIQEGSIANGPGTYEQCDDGKRCTGGDNDGDACTDDVQCPNGGSCDLQVNDGCDDSCQLESDEWSCPVPGQPCVNCGNGTIEDQGDFIKEQCDDGNNRAGSCSLDNAVACATDADCLPTSSGVCEIDGCDASCQVMPGADCATPGPNVPCIVCGDGTISGLETCDDSNRWDGDGCSSTCQTDTAGGWICPDNAGTGGPCYKCGNAVLEQGTQEECDDGNVADADGCDSDCGEEVGWTCVELPGKVRSTCDTCGNGQIKIPVGQPGHEACDDGNTDDLDGCDDLCALEPGWTCPAPAGIPCNNCGNGEIEGLELCDDSGIAGGCAANCLSIAPHFLCPDPGEACIECGDGVVDAPEKCDDGEQPPDSNDGCRGDCLAIEPGYVCPNPDQLCTLCGNGVLDGNEDCDDGANVSVTDGCLPDCSEQAGWDCFPSANNPLKSICDQCGNGLVRGDEECDDGNAVTTDGCNACVQDPAYTCPEDPNVQGTGGLCYRCDDGVLQPGETCDDNGATGGCINDCKDVAVNWWCPPLAAGACEHCGNSIIDPHEVCDDGLNQNNDGCRDDCKQVEEGWICTNGSCTQCGNGVLDGVETCDDGIYPPLNGGGCSATCTTELGYTCYPGQPCELCGDGVLEPHEDCDDDNTADNDGCAANCQAIENGWSCPVPSIPCNLCGDGTIQGVEQCDDGKHCSGGSEPGTACVTNPDCAGGGTCVLQSGDGCSSCNVDPGWGCDNTAPPSECSSNGCGDGFVAGSEECDDGNGLNGDGCNAVCAVEDGFSCPAQGGACVASVCGDGLITGSEACDPLHATNGPNCPLTCGICGDGIVSAAEDCDDGCGDGNCTGADDGDGCSQECAWEDNFACTGTAPTYVCVADPTCGNGIRGNTEQCDDGNAVDDDGCTNACVAGAFYDCDGAVGVVSDCDVAPFVAVRAFDVSNVDPKSLLYDPFTRSFVGYKSGTSQAPVELCLDGTMIDHPKDGGSGCIYMPGSDVCQIITNPGTWSDAQTRTWPVASVSISITGATYDPFTNTWFILDEGTLRRIDYLTTLASNPAVDTPVSVNATGLLNDASGIAIGDDGLLYVTIMPSGNNPRYIRSFARDPAATLNTIGFIFTNFVEEWEVEGEATLDGIVTLTGFNAVAVLNDVEGFYVADGINDDAFKEFRAFNPDGSLYGISEVSGVLFMDNFIDGTSLPGNPGQLYDSNVAGDAMETATDGSGFILCNLNNSVDCYLWAKTCEDDSDCVSGATCQEGDIVKFCANVGDARDDFDATAVGQPVVVDNLPNDSKGQGFCRSTTFTITGKTDGIFGGTVVIGTTPGQCAGAQVPCTIYTPPTDGTCNIIDRYTYTVDLGGGEFDTATVFVTVSCDCGNGVVDPGEECDPEENGGPPCTASCTAIETCGDGVTQGSETCDNGGRCVGGSTPNVVCQKGDALDCPGGSCATFSGDGCSWDCLVEGCGNGIEEGSEQCDDGNIISGDGCRENCTDELCGDGIPDPPLEQCDDGGECQGGTDPANTPCEKGMESIDCPGGGTCVTQNGDGCSATCTIQPFCGDTIINGTEECDDGNTNNGDACRNTCLLPSCGDDITDAGEECDGQPNCSWDCKLTGCGNGAIDGVEECDDGNTDTGDGCNDNCEIEACPNGVVDDGEECDDGPSTPLDECRNDCTLAFCGDLFTSNGEECDDGNMSDGDGCDSDCNSEAVCGDGNVDMGAGEECDQLDNNENGDGCSWNCLLEVCGNNRIDPGEICDDGNDIETDTCRGPDSGPTHECTVPACGDGVVDAFRGEECDEGDLVNGDGCSAFCFFESVCPNGEVEPGEDCDDGNSDPGDGCSASCTWESCGDGVTDPGEDCDPADSPTWTPLTCRPDCSVRDCPDGIVDPGEFCDDGNNTDTDFCKNNCTFNTICGNGTREGAEICDDGNTTAGDGCSAACNWEYCGNGIQDPGEQCDHGMANGGANDSCSSTCTNQSVCGNGTKESGEQCDDGNKVSMDGCSSNCKIEQYCGDGNLDAGEACDDGADNGTGDSQCTVNCTIIIPK